MCSQTLVLKSKLGLTCEVGATQENIKKNRYKDVLPCKGAFTPVLSSVCRGRISWGELTTRVRSGVSAGGTWSDDWRVRPR